MKHPALQQGAMAVFRLFEPLSRSRRFVRQSIFHRTFSKGDSLRFGWHAYFSTGDSIASEIVHRGSFCPLFIPICANAIAYGFMVLGGAVWLDDFQDKRLPMKTVSSS